MYRPWGSHCLLLPMVSSLYCLYVYCVIVTFICIKKADLELYLFLHFPLRLITHSNVLPLKLKETEILCHKLIQRITY